jgi:hypothetical protein
MEGKRNKLKSSKLWVTICTIVLVVANEGLGLGVPEDAYWAVVTPAMAYVLGESYIDAKK